MTKDEIKAVMRVIDWRLNELARDTRQNREYNLLRSAWEILKQQSEEK